MFMDYLNGLYSGFPHCCVVWYVYARHILKWELPAAKSTELFGQYRDYENWQDGYIQYVQCPKCRKNRTNIAQSEMKLGFYCLEPNNKIGLYRWIEENDIYEVFDFQQKDWKFYGTGTEVWEEKQQTGKVGSKKV